MKFRVVRLISSNQEVNEMLFKLTEILFASSLIKATQNHIPQEDWVIFLRTITPN